MRNNLMLTAGAVLIVVLVGMSIWNNVGKPPLGEEITVSGDGDHVADGNPLPAYSSDPPTSGTHYISSLPEGFYDENSQEAVSLANPEGYLVHNLEHGYVIFWYNCEILNESECTELKTELRTLMMDYNNFKIIGFPWKTTDVPLVGTSWGRYLEFETWDKGTAAAFIERNRNKSPEPNAR